MRKQVILGNWKMNGNFAEIKSLCESLNRVVSDDAQADVAVCVPFVYVDYVRANIIKEIGLGAQNVSEHDNGAYTGEISASMLKDLNCDYVIVGHSERRTLFQESNQLVAKKAKKAIASGMKAIVCVGETLAERNEGELERVLTAQVEILFDILSEKELEEVIIAYEPVWAIGTGLAATPEQVQSVHKFIRSVVTKSNELLAKSIRIVYGGSLKPSNAKTLLALEDVDGGLIGGASLKGEDFGEIINQAKCITC